MTINIKFIDVESSTVEKIGYHFDKNILFVKFSAGGGYLYENVPAEVFHNLLISESKGSYIHKNIKNKYEFTKVETLS